MPYISYNSEKPEESSLPPRVGQEHCQQQFHHRFVCLRLFFLSTVLSFRQTARAKSNPAVSRLQPGYHPHLHSGHVLLVPLAKSRHQVGVLHIIVVTITDTMANNIFTNSIFSIYEAANIHSILDCRERGLPWILDSTKSTRNIMTLICSWKKHCAILSLQGGTRPQFGSCTSPTLFNSSWWVTEAFYHTCNQFEILILNCDMKNVRMTGSMSWTKYQKEKARWNICCQYIFPGCERLSEPSDILLCWQNFPGGHHQPCEVGKKKFKKNAHIHELNLLDRNVAFKYPYFPLLIWYIGRTFLWMYTISSILCVSQGLIK